MILGKARARKCDLKATLEVESNVCILRGGIKRKKDNDLYSVRLKVRHKGFVMIGPQILFNGGELVF